MTIIATASTYTPPAPPATPAATATPAPAAKPDTDQDAQTAAPEPANDTNANDTAAPAIYTAQAGASTSNIRGTTVNTTA